MSVNIRKAEKKDINNLIQLSQKFTKSESNYDKFIKIREKNELIKYFTEHLDSKDSFVACAESNNKLVGFLLAHMRIEENIWKKRFGYISDAYVLEEFRKQGICKEMVDLALNWFKQKGINEVTLLVFNKNVPTMNIWHSLGFKEWQTELMREI